MRTWLALLVALLSCGAECAFAQGEDSTKSFLPPGTRVRVEYRSAHDITVGTLVRGGPDTLIVRPESVLRDARFLTKDVRDFAWWYAHPRISVPENSGRNWLATTTVLTLAGMAFGLLLEMDPGLADMLGPLALPADLLFVGGAAYFTVHLIAPGGEWVHEPLSDVRFSHAASRVPGATVALTIRR